MINFKKENEMRLKVDENIASKLKGIKTESHEEVDEYFLTKEMIDRRIFLRFRNKKEKIFLELKAIVVGGKNVSISEADEIETEITHEQYEKFKKIFNVLFPITVNVKKIRSKGIFNECEICHDKVEGLGDFLEIEGSREKILEICKNLNIDIERQKDREEGYTMMTLRKMGLI